MARLRQGETARLVACLIWEEDLKRQGKTYGDLLAYMESLNMPCAVSPWHNKDRYTAEDVRGWVDRHIDPDFYDFISEDLEEVRSKAPKVGDCKKSHAHILIKSKGPRNRHYFTKNIMGPFIDIPDSKWEKVEHLDSYICYLCHKNTPSKYRYSELDVHGFGGIDLSPLLNKKDAMEKTNVFLLVKAQIRSQGWRYFHQLDEWADSTRDMDIISCVSGRVSYFSALFRSRREERQDKAAAVQDKAKSMQEGHNANG